MAESKENTTGLDSDRHEACAMQALAAATTDELLHQFSLEVVGGVADGDLEADALELPASEGSPSRLLSLLESEAGLDMSPGAENSPLWFSKPQQEREDLNTCDTLTTFAPALESQSASFVSQIDLLGEPVEDREDLASSFQARLQSAATASHSRLQSTTSLHRRIASIPSRARALACIHQARAYSRTAAAQVSSAVQLCEHVAGSVGSTLACMAQLTQQQLLLMSELQEKVRASSHASGDLRSKLLHQMQKLHDLCQAQLAAATASAAAASASAAPSATQPTPGPSTTSSSSPASSQPTAAAPGSISGSDLQVICSQLRSATATARHLHAQSLNQLHCWSHMQPSLLHAALNHRAQGLNQHQDTQTHLAHLQEQLQEEKQRYLEALEALQATQAQVEELQRSHDGIMGAGDMSSQQQQQQAEQMQMVMDLQAELAVLRRHGSQGREIRDHVTARLDKQHQAELQQLREEHVEIERRHAAELAQLQAQLQEQQAHSAMLQSSVEKLRGDVELRDQMLCLLSQPEDGSAAGGELSQLQASPGLTGVASPPPVDLLL